MGLDYYIESLKAAQAEAAELSEITETIVKIYVNDGYFVIQVFDNDRNVLYTSECGSDDKLYNELQALIIGAKLAKRIEI